LRLSDCYIQSSRLEGVIVPHFQSLFLGWNQQHSCNRSEMGY
jgi:hypothetical protein